MSLGDFEVVKRLGKYNFLSIYLIIHSNVTKLQEDFMNFCSVDSTLLFWLKFNWQSGIEYLNMHVIKVWRIQRLVFDNSNICNP